MGIVAILPMFFTKGDVMTEAKLALRFRYTNHLGEESVRTVRPLCFHEGVTSWYGGWHLYMLALDLDSGEQVAFIMSRMEDMEEIELP